MSEKERHDERGEEDRRRRKEGAKRGRRGTDKNPTTVILFGKTHLDWRQTNDREMEMVPADGTSGPLAEALSFTSREF